MKAEDICKAVKVPCKGDNKKHAMRLAEIYRFISTLPSPIKVEKQIEPMVFGEEGEKMQGEKFTLQYALGKSTATYSVHIPTGNKFHSAFCALIGIETTAARTEYDFEFDAEITRAIYDAIPFASTDELRPALCSVCLDFNGDTLKVVATDCYIMYYSKLFKSPMPGKQFKYLLPANELAAIVKQKTKTLKVLYVDSETLLLNGVEIKMCTERYPDYESIIPEHKTSAVVDNARLSQTLHGLKGYWNKNVPKATFVLKASKNLYVKACDVDMSQEVVHGMIAKCSDIERFAISLNGVNVLKALKKLDAEVSIWTNGMPDRCVVLEDGSRSFLVMPYNLDNSEVDYNSGCDFEIKTNELYIKPKPSRQVAVAAKKKVRVRFTDKPDPVIDEPAAPVSVAQAPTNANEKAVRIYMQYYQALALKGYKVTAHASDGIFKIRWIGLSNGSMLRGQRSYAGNLDTVNYMASCIH